ncbi:MAG: hypothetical protein COA57_08745 [Flavobacteriales bacterium]|nr:MAG: hypothetical protein COA57_08745 [Flavobacteriales bacterium]
MKIENNNSNTNLVSNWYEKPYLIFFSSVFVVILFETLSMSPGHELALAYVPAFFLCLGLVLTLLYWALKKLFKRKLLVVYYLFLLSNLAFSLYLTIGMYLD